MSTEAASAAPAASSDASGAPQSTTLPFTPGEAPGSTTTIPATDAGTAHSVQKQIEYYFSDANLPKDKFLMAECAKNDDGWVDIAILAGFNRIKQLLPSGSVEAIASALKESRTLIVSEDGTKVRRPDGAKKVITLGGAEYKSREEVIAHARSLIAGGDASGGVLSDDAQNFVKDILAHHANKAEKEGCGVAKVKVGRNPSHPDTSCFVIVRTDGSEVDFSYLKCLDRVYGTPAGRSPGGAKRKREGGEGEDASKRGGKGAPAPVEYEPGKILVFKSLPEGIDRHALKDKLGGVDKGCSFVEVVPGMPLAYARFATPEQAKAALDVGELGEVATLEGDDERQYWEKIASESRNKGKGGGKGGRGKGGKGKGRGGKGRKGGRGR